MKSLKLTVFACACFMFSGLQAQMVYKVSKLTWLWETKPGIKTPESVLIDPSGKVLYVSNVNDKPWEKDYNGYISKISPKGEIITLEWVKGLSAPKGMGISKGMLYVTDIDSVAEIDIAKGKIVSKFGNPKAQNLNDITVGEDGTIYVSDSKGNCIFYVHNGKLDVLAESDDVKQTNGIFYEKGYLLLGQANRMAKFDLKTKTVTTYIDNTGYIDGLEAVGDGSYIISDWAGHVNFVKPGSPNQLILNTADKKVNAADVEYNPKEKILYVPTFFDNHVVAYKVDLSTIQMQKAK